MSNVTATICPECAKMRWTNVAHRCEKAPRCPSCDNRMVAHTGDEFACPNDDCPEFLDTYSRAEIESRARRTA